MILYYWSPSLRPMTITPILPIFQTEDTRYKTGASLLNNMRATKSEGKPDFSKNSSVVLIGPKLNKTQPFKNLQIHYYKLCRLSDSVAGNLQLYTSLGKFSKVLNSRILFDNDSINTKLKNFPYLDVLFLTPGVMCCLSP